VTGKTNVKDRYVKGDT